MGAQVIPTGPRLAPDDSEVPDIPSSANQAQTVNRVTKDGRRLWYSLKVIQQPERARACGSGPKSSSDRRPVDPPPVVMLRIFEGPTYEAAQANDITIRYNANFFLFATLEHARVIAQARGQNAAQIPPPILTGMPVSGMAYLDRPQEAGYFLFPDLSVRHEGRYRLAFNLYEETKEDKDKDPNATAPAASFGSNLSGASLGSFDFRMEIKSQDFVVYSAKKFPGLAESTGLSREIAEQGCRVRIRRDVRMRRRDGKGGGTAPIAPAVSATADAEEEYRRRRATATPDIKSESFRARSMSGSTERTPYAGDVSRRPSMTDYTPRPPQFPGPTQQASAGGHLQFLGNSGSPQFPAHPSQAFAQAGSVPPSPVYPPGHQSYQSQPPYPTTPSTPYGPDSRGSQSYAPAPTRRDSAQLDYRSSISSASSVALPPLSLASQPTPFSSQAPLRPRKSITTLPPLQVDPSILGASALLAAASPTMAAAPRSASISALGSSLTPRSAMPYAHAGTKRPRDPKMSRDPEQQRRHNGARDTGSEDDDEEPLMVYRRADGKYEKIG